MKYKCAESSIIHLCKEAAHSAQTCGAQREIRNTLKDCTTTWLFIFNDG